MLMKTYRAIMFACSSIAQRLSNSVLKTGSRRVSPAQSLVSLFEVWLLVFLFLAPDAYSGQKKPIRSKPKSTTASKAKTTQAKPTDDLAKLRDEYIKATNEYQSLLKKQLPGLERNVVKEEDQVTKLSQLFAEGLVSKKDVEAGEMAVGQAKDKVTEIHQAIATADSRIADALLEAEAEKTLAKLKPIPRGSLISTAAMIRFNGGSGWLLSDAWKVQRFFLDAFRRPLPVAVFGQGSIHERWRLDHRNSMDVSLHPDGPEGQALLNYLRTKGIPFLAFRQAIPGTATGPHIHVGRPSHRY